MRVAALPCHFCFAVLYVLATGLASAQTETDTLPGTQLAPKFTVFVKDPEGRAVKDAIVLCSKFSFQGEPSRQPLPDKFKRRTDAAGRVVFDPQDIGDTFFRICKGPLGGWFRFTNSAESPPQATFSIDIGRTYYGTVHVVDGDASGVEVLGNGDLSAAITDAEGNFKVTNVGIGFEPDLAFVKEGYAAEWHQLAFSRERFEVTLVPGGFLHGEVLLPDGSAVPQAHLGYVDHSERYVHCLTDEAGRFVIGPVPFGIEIRLNPSANIRGISYSLDTKVIFNKGAETPLRLQLAPVDKFSVSGRVVHAVTGEPVQAEIRDFSSGSYFARKVASSDVNGRFTVNAMARYGLNVIAVPASPKQYHLNPPMRLNPEASEAVVIKIAEGAAVRGKVLDSDGNPVENTWVQLEPGGGQDATIATGRFELLHLPPQEAEQELVVQRRLAPAFRQKIGPLPEGTIKNNVLVRLPAVAPPTWLSGSVVDTSGKAVTNADVRFVYTEEDSNFALTATTDAAGGFHLEFAYPGKVTAAVSKLSPIPDHFAFWPLKFPAELDLKPGTPATIKLIVQHPEVP